MRETSPPPPPPHCLTLLFTPCLHLQIFSTLACITETLVFLYMGMSVFTGAFTDWNPGVTIMLLSFCVVARACHIFPLTYLCNLCRPQNSQIPRKMTFVMWFVGLRGAIAFALACNMPGPNKKSYVANTLAICIFTTVVCGGVTEKILTRYGMKQTSKDLDPDGGGDPYETLVPPGGAGSRYGRADSYSRRLNAHAHSTFKKLDELYFKPMFGGRGEDSRRRGQAARDSVRLDGGSGLSAQDRSEDDDETHEMIGELALFSQLLFTPPFLPLFTPYWQLLQG